MREETKARRYALVTGASSGIGLETARGLSSQFDVVGIVGRNSLRLAEAAELAEDPGLRRYLESRSDALRRQGDTRDLAIELLLGAPVDEPKSQNQQHQAKNDRKTTLFPPSHAAGSIGRDIRLSKQSRRGAVVLRVKGRPCYGNERWGPR